MKKFIAFALAVLSSAAASAIEPGPIRSCDDLSVTTKTCIMSVANQNFTPASHAALVDNMKMMSTALQKPVFIALQATGDRSADTMRLEMICEAAGVECRIRQVPVGSSIIDNAVNAVVVGARINVR